MEFPISLEKISYWFVGITFILFSTYHLIVMNKNYNIVIDKKRMLKNIYIVGFMTIFLMLLRFIAIYTSL